MWLRLVDDVSDDVIGEANLIEQFGRVFGSEEAAVVGREADGRVALGRSGWNKVGEVVVVGLEATLEKVSLRALRSAMLVADCACGGRSRRRRRR